MGNRVISVRARGEEHNNKDTETMVQKCYRPLTVKFFHHFFTSLPFNIHTASVTCHRDTELGRIQINRISCLIFEAAQSEMDLSIFG